MQFSRFTHFYDVGDNAIGVFHSLLVRTVFLSVEEKSAIDFYLGKGFPLNEELKETVNYLFANYYIVNSDKEDENLYRQCVGMIPPPRHFQCLYCRYRKLQLQL